MSRKSKAKKNNKAQNKHRQTSHEPQARVNQQTEKEEVLDTPQETEQDDRTSNELEEMKDKYLRLLAEFENYKNRTARQQLEMLADCAGKTLLKILPIVDDFDRAAKQEEFPEGVALVHKKLQNTLKQIGIEPVESDGADFNPELHEAVTELPVQDDKLAGKVVDTIEKGYLYNGKVLRYAKVVVGRKQ